MNTLNNEKLLILLIYKKKMKVRSSLRKLCDHCFV